MPAVMNAALPGHTGYYNTGGQSVGSGGEGIISGCGAADNSWRRCAVGRGGCNEGFPERGKGSTGGGGVQAAPHGTPDGELDGSWTDATECRHVDEKELACLCIFSIGHADGERSGLVRQDRSKPAQQGGQLRTESASTAHTIDVAGVHRRCGEPTLQHQCSQDSVGAMASTHNEDVSASDFFMVGVAHYLSTRGKTHKFLFTTNSSTVDVDAASQIGSRPGVAGSTLNVCSATIRLCLSLTTKACLHE